MDKHEPHNTKSDTTETEEIKYSPKMDANHNVTATSRTPDLDLDLAFNIDLDFEGHILDEASLSELSTPSPSLKAHESAIEFGSFSYSTLPNSTPVPDLFARWHQFRQQLRRAHARRGDPEIDWACGTCAKKRGPSRLVWLMIILTVVLVVSAVVIASVWVTSASKIQSNTTDMTTDGSTLSFYTQTESLER